LLLKRPGNRKIDLFWFWMAYIAKYNLQTNKYIYIDYDNAPSTKDDPKKGINVTQWLSDQDW